MMSPGSPGVSFKTVSNVINSHPHVAEATVNDDHCAVFLLNRSVTESAEIQLDISALDFTEASGSLLLADADAHARNTNLDPDRVRLRVNPATEVNEGVLSVEIPPISWAAVSLI